MKSYNLQLTVQRLSARALRKLFRARKKNFVDERIDDRIKYEFSCPAAIYYLCVFKKSQLMRYSTLSHRKNKRKIRNAQFFHRKRG